MPRKGIHQLMIYEEKQLLRHSAVINEHPELQPVLERFEKIIDSDTENPEFKEYLTDDIVNFFKYGFDTLIDEAQKEWHQTPFEEVVKKGTVACELCGNNQLVYLRKIRNEKTNKELVVGTDCIDKFTSIYKSVETAIALRQKRKDATAIRRQVDINTKIPNVGNLISNWFSFLNENPIVLPKDLEDGLRTLLDKARGLYDGYINSKPNYGESAIKAIQNMLPSIEQFLTNINQYNEENKNRPYICDNNLRRWIIDAYGSNSNVLSIIKSNGGYFTKESIIYIHEPNFVKTQIALIEQTLNDNHLFCLNSNDGSLCFEYTRHEPYKFVLTCSFNSFMKECSTLINGTFNINMDNLYEILKINDTFKDDDYYLPIAFCDSLLTLNKSTYRISYNDTGDNRLFVKKAPNYQRNEKAMFSHIALEPLYKQLETLIFKYDDKYIYERIVAKFDIYKNWKTYEQVKDYFVDDKLITGDHYIYRRPRR